MESKTIEPDDVKWKSVETTSREVMYFTNKVTGQQKWTNKNCYCSKPKDPLQPTLPCCYKVSSLSLKSTEQDLTKHSYARRQHKALFSKKLYCLSDIVSEVQKSLLAKGHRKHKRKECEVALNFKKKLAVNEELKTDVTITKNPLSDDNSEKPKDDVIVVVDFQNHVSISNEDTNEDAKTVNDSNNDSKIAADAKNDISVKGDSSSDVNVSNPPQPLSKEPKDNVVSTELTQNDDTAVNDVGRAITVANDSKDANAFVERKNDVTEAQDSDFIDDITTVNDITKDKENDASGARDSNDVLTNEPVITNVTATENMEADVTSVDGFNDDVTVVKDLSSEAKDSSDVSDEPGKTNVVTATENMELDVRSIEDSNVVSNDPGKTKDVSATESMELDVTSIDDIDNDVTVVKNPKDDIATKDKENDTSEAKDSSDVSDEPGKTNDVTATENMELDVTSKDAFANDGTVVKNLNSEAKDSSDVSDEPGSKTNDVTATENMELDVTSKDAFDNDVTVVKNLNSEAKDSSNVSDGPGSKTNDVTATENMELDVTSIDINYDVTAVKDVIATKDKENDTSGAKDANDVSNEPSKLNDKVMPSRGLKRKREANDNVNGYKGRLRVRQNKMKINFRRKYRRRKPLASAAVTREPSQPDSIVTSKLNPAKKQRLAEVDNKVLQTNCDLIEQSIIEINRFTSGYFANFSKPKPDLESGGAEAGMANSIPEKIENTNPDLKATSKNKVPVDTSEPRFIDEQLVQMNVPFQSGTKLDIKKSTALKTVDGVHKKRTKVSERKRQNVLPTFSYTNRSKLRSSSSVSKRMSKKVLTVNLASYRPAAIKMITSASSSCTAVPSLRQSPSSLTSLSEFGKESLQTKSRQQVNNTETSNRRHLKQILDSGKLNSKIKGLSSSKLVNNKNFLPFWGKFGFPPKRSRRQKSLDTIVNSMNSPYKAEVPLTSTTSMTSWLTTLSKESTKIQKSNTETNEDNLSGSESVLYNEQIGGVSGPNDMGTDCPESDSLVLGHFEETYSLGSMPRLPSTEPAVQERSQLNSGLTIPKKPDNRKGLVGRKPKNTCESGTYTTEGKLFQTPDQDRNVTEVPASHVDLSWRIVTSNDGHSSSLRNFFKLVPITIARGPNGEVDSKEPRSFLGVPMHGGPAVIAKILNTSVAQNCNEVFTLSRKPGIVTAGTYIKKSTLSFVWDRDSVSVNSESVKAGSLSGKDVKPRPPVWIDICNRVSIILPKKLRLPEAGNVVYLGDFNVKDNHVEFVVTHSVVVTTSPRPSLTVPSGTPVSSSTISKAIKCRSPGKAKSKVPAAQALKKALVDKEATGGGVKTFQKCVFCGSGLMCRRDVKIHRKLHASFEGTKCSECKRRFHDGGRLSVHLDTHKCNWFHVCASCKKPYRTPKFLTETDLANDYYKMCLPCRRKQLKCKKCTEMLLTFSDLKLHLQEKHGLYCPICNGSFLFKHDLSSHMRTEHEITSVPPSDTTKS